MEKLFRNIAAAAVVLLLLAGVSGAFSFGEKEEPGVRLAKNQGILPHVLADSDPYGTYPVAPNTSLAGKIIYLDPGHGKESDKVYAGYSEQYYNLQIALAIKTDLENCGATVIMTRSTETDVENYTRISVLNKHTLSLLREAYQAELGAGAAGASLQQLTYDISELTRLEAVMQSVISNHSLSDIYYNSPYDYTYTRVMHPDLKKIFKYQTSPLISSRFLFISVHANATGSPINESVSGTVVYYMTNTLTNAGTYYKNYHCVDRSQYFSARMIARVTEAAGFKNRGLAVNDFFMIREHNVPAALLETAFFTSPSDRSKLMDVTYHRRIANAVTMAAQEYFVYADATWPAAAEVPLSVSGSAFTASKAGITGIPLGSTVEALLADLTSAYSLRVTNASGTVKAGADLLATGDLVQLLNGENKVYASYPVILYGDASGDGAVDIADLLTMQKYLLDIKDLNNAYFLAGDVSKSEGITILDLLMAQKYLLGLGNITQ